MSSRKEYQPTPEEIAIAQAKKAERLKKRQAKAEKPDITTSSRSIIQRPWLSVPIIQETSEDNLNLKVFTWNVSI